MANFGIKEGQRVCVLIDGPSFFATHRALGFDVDFRKLLGHFEENAELHRAIYFTAVSEGDDYTPVKPLVDWLSYNGFRLVSKPLREFTEASGRRRTKGALTVEIAVEMLENSAFAEHLLLFSGDGELAYAVEAVQRRGCRVTVVSSVKPEAMTVSDDLRRVADRFVDLADVKDIIFKRDITRLASDSMSSASRMESPGEAVVLERRPRVSALTLPAARRV